MAKSKLAPSKEVNRLIKKAKQQGWSVRKTKNAHILFYPPDSALGFVTMPSTPSSTRNFKNYVNQLKMRGLVI